MPRILGVKIAKFRDKARKQLDRSTQLGLWLESHFPRGSFALKPASADASFRRYFRIDFAAARPSLIVMDAPPPQEDCRPFVRVAGLLEAAGVHAPKVLAQDLDQGFLLLTDLGDTTYLAAVNENNADALFNDALNALVLWQLASRPAVLPPYDDALLRRELALFPDWYVSRHLGVSLGASQQQALGSIFDAIVSSNLAQPTVFVHRDYMPRNLMVCEPNPGVLDFQDAVCGPISYDVASLFKDAFLSWPEERVLDWTVRYWQKAKKAGLPVRADFGDFYAECEWMGLQRHLKVLGIFARLNYRDGKADYLADTPRFIRYVRNVSSRYGRLKPLLLLLDELENVSVKTGYTF
jgi:aminoglycoside/choline kinase family phosphotransferase